MAEWGPFMSYWGAYYKDVFQNALMGSDARIIFSEGLLHALYYETDVGCIPRGIKLGSKGIAPKFVDAKNWNKQIQGCYWCQDDNNTFQGVCCERECFYLLHEWCIERAVHFTRDRFCRLPGCNKVTYTNNIYCNEAHRAKFDSTFPKWTNNKSPGLKSAICAGPTWYHPDQDSSKNNTSSESSTHPQSKHPYDLRSKSASNSTQLKSIKVQFNCSLPMEFRNILIHQTDIGVIPRTCPSQEDLASKYSQCPNWSAVIKGCYYCGRPETKDSMNDHFCQLRCYLLFYEWCRTKVESMVKMNFCQYPECPRKAAEGFHCCTRDHTVKIPDLYKDNRINNMGRIISVAPKWYVKANTPHELVPHLHYIQPQSLSTDLGAKKSVKSQTIPPRSNNYQETIHFPGDYIDISQTDKIEKKLENEPQLSTNLSHIDCQASERLYCNGKHRAKFNAAFAKGSDYESLSRTVIRAGPSWYSSSGNSQSLIQQNKDKSNKNSPNIMYTQQEAQTYNIPTLVAYDMKFPIELRNAMIFKSDIGPIPREGIKEQHLASPYSSSPNWLRDINGCVRCGNKSMTQTGNGNFCTFRCYLLFYEWCRRLVESLTGISLCKDTGCNRLAAEGFGCCSKEHVKDLDDKYSQVKHGDFGRLIRLGPIWYKKCDFPRDIATTLKAETFAEPLRESTKLKQRTTPFKISQKENNSGFIANLNLLPEDYKSPFNITNEEQELPLNTDFSSSESQSDEGSFCEKNDQFFGGIPVTELSDPIDNETNPFLTSAKTANSKVRYTNIAIQPPTSVAQLNEQHTSETNTIQNSSFFDSDYIKPQSLSTDLGAKKSVKSQTIPPRSYNYEETLQLPGDYIDISQTDKIEKKLENGPQLSTKLPHIDCQASERITSNKAHQPEVTATADTMPHSNNTGYGLILRKSQSLTEPTPQQHSVQIHPGIYPFSLSTQLTHLLSQYTDVGVIPRHSRAPHAHVPSEYAAQINWGARVTGCYWCQLSNSSFHELTCSRRCWLLFHEWCVRKIETSCGARLCALPGCENSRASGCMCCSLEHIKDVTELRGSAYLTNEDEVELILGPNWYSDLSPIHFSRTGAFYEFSNYFPSLLILEGSIWPSVYHYLCARKLVGTPYSNHISRMECVKELEIWMNRRTCAKWVRADWRGVWEVDTYRAVFAKFQQNSVLRGLLLRTGRRPLVCRDSSLGDVLVGMREMFRTQRFFPTIQLEASISSVCKSIHDTLIVSKTPIPPPQDGVKESLPTEKSVESIHVPNIKGNQTVSDVIYAPYSDHSDSDD